MTSLKYQSYLFVCEEAIVDVANIASSQFSGDTKTFSTPLSPTGSGEPTHYCGHGQVTPDQATAVFKGVSVHIGILNQAIADSPLGPHINIYPTEGTTVTSVLQGLGLSIID